MPVPKLVGVIIIIKWRVIGRTYIRLLVSPALPRFHHFMSSWGLGYAAGGLAQLFETRFVPLLVRWETADDRSASTRVAVWWSGSRKGAI